jgi:hypothetical protein
VHCIERLGKIQAKNFRGIGQFGGFSLLKRPQAVIRCSS